MKTQAFLVLTKRFISTANRSIASSKHNRYAPYQNTRTNFELNYVLQGECQQIINITYTRFTPGDILLMDAGSAHMQLSLLEKTIY